jgi:hypothetical protein
VRASTFPRQLQWLSRRLRAIWRVDDGGCGGDRTGGDRTGGDRTGGERASEAVPSCLGDACLMLDVDVMQ